MECTARAMEVLTWQLMERVRVGVSGIHQTIADELLAEQHPEEVAHG